MTTNPPTTAASASNTRERLLERAIDVFGKQGFSGATTRMIASAAEVNISAIPYYFNGKEGLYTAVVEHIGEQVQLLMQETLLEIENGMRNPTINPQEAMDLLEIVLTNLINFLLGSTEALRFTRIILREHLDPSAAYGTIFSHIMSPLLTNIARLITIVTGISDPREVRLRALAVMGQAMTFRIARETMVRLLDLDGYSPKERDEIRRVILEQTRAALTGLSAKPQKQMRHAP